jgi:imidazole glycerol phosphate synthase glutamine amidotransferase subunit
MRNMIGIVDYGTAGNVHSVKKAIEKAGGNTLVISSSSELNLVDKLVIPGVGSFKDAMQELDRAGLIGPIQEFNKPILGICLGMQILANLGFEFGKTKGLGLIDSEVKLISCKDNIPHMGFNKIRIKASNALLNGIEDEEFYFMHSYSLVSSYDLSSTTMYGEHEFISSVNNNNIYGVQFHPEKSREPGIKMFKNFIDLEWIQ